MRQFDFRITLSTGLALCLTLTLIVSHSHAAAPPSTQPGVDETYAFATLAGNAGWANWGSADGTGTVARFKHPNGVAVDGAGNVYVADSDNDTIRKISPEGAVTTLAGQAGNAGSRDGTGSEALFYKPYGIAVDGAGNMYVADTFNHTIRMVGPTGVVTTVAGLAGSVGGTDATGSAARFAGPSGIAVDGAGYLYVADAANHAIRKISPAGEVTTLAGLAGNQGSADGTGNVARFYWPAGVAVDTGGNVYVADSYNHTIRKITPQGSVTTLAGQAGSPGSTDATTADRAQFAWPKGVAVDGAGNVYVADYGNYTIRKIRRAGGVVTVAGLAQSSGTADGSASAARFYLPFAVAMDGAGSLYVADTFNHRISKGRPACEPTDPLAGKIYHLAYTTGWSGNLQFLDNGMFGITEQSGGATSYGYYVYSRSSCTKVALTTYQWTGASWDVTWSEWNFNDASYQNGWFGLYCYNGMSGVWSYYAAAEFRPGPSFSYAPFSLAGTTWYLQDAGSGVWSWLCLYADGSFVRWQSGQSDRGYYVYTRESASNGRLGLTTVCACGAWSYETLLQRYTSASGGHFEGWRQPPGGN